MTDIDAACAIGNPFPSGTPGYASVFARVQFVILIFTFLFS